jgi:hypothetical protein
MRPSWSDRSEPVAIPIPLQAGQWVVLVLQEPRERVWGRLLGLEPAGVLLRGLDVKPWEEVLQTVRAGQADQVSVGTRFYPLHRVESLYLDEASSGTPSLVDDFVQRTGRDPEAALGLRA